MERTSNQSTKKTAISEKSDVIDRAFMELTEIEMELQSYSHLLCSMEACTVNGELNGLGISLRKIHRQIEGIVCDLATVPRFTPKVTSAS